MSGIGPKSIRGRVTLVTVLGTLVAMVVMVAVVGFSAYMILKQLTTESTNRYLDKAAMAVGLGNYEEAVKYAGSDVFQILDEDGNVIAASFSATGLGSLSDSIDLEDGQHEFDDIELQQGLTEPTDDTSSDATDGSANNPPSGPMGPANSGRVVDASSFLEDEGPFLVVSRDTPSPQGSRTLVAMTSFAPAVRAVNMVALVLGILMVVVLGIVALASWSLVGHTLKPVEKMRSDVEAIKATNLSDRIEVPEGDKDLSRLAVTFNDLLGRVEKTVDDQKRFISDASHELKSPVAATGLMLETLRDHPEAVDQQQVLEDLTSENERMGHIVTNLLTLARQDEGRSKIERVPIDLMDLIFDEVAILATHSTVEVQTTNVQPVVCTADAEALGRAIRNLLDNAARYAASRIVVGCSEDNGTVRIEVSDDGCGIAPEDRERVFGRFVRLEDSRNRKQGSTGLGLAVVQGIAEQHGGKAYFTDPTIGGATAVIEFPAEA